RRGRRREGGNPSSARRTGGPRIGIAGDLVRIARSDEPEPPHHGDAARQRRRRVGTQRFFPDESDAPDGGSGGETQGNGVMEWWSNGSIDTPSLQYSITPFVP